jgi:hypothetical protein
VYDDLKPRALTEEEMLRSSRPAMAQVDDISVDLRALSKAAAEAKQAQQTKEEAAAMTAEQEEEGVEGKGQ